MCDGRQIRPIFSRVFLSCELGRILAALILLVPNLSLADEAEIRQYDLPAGDAADTLRQFAEQSGEQIVYLVDSLRGRKTAPLRGEFPPRQALERLLEGTDLVIVQDSGTGAFAVNRRAETDAEEIEPRPTRQADGFVIGQISNRATGVYLAGAVISIDGDGVAATTDSDGSYRIALEPGSHVVSVSYPGLDGKAALVHVVSAQRTRCDFALASEIYRMSEYVVASEREGSALAIALQRQSPNLKNVVSADAFGSLAGNPADLLERVPGVTIDRVGGDIRFLAIRGSRLNAVQLDGNRIASTGADGRGFQFQNIGTDHIESMEIVKAPTPDSDADSIGGSVNLKSRSAFDLVGRRLQFSLGGIVGANRDSPHEAVAFSYSDVFDALGGERNLGLSVSAGWRTHRATLDNVRQDFQRTNASPAYRYRTEIRDFTNIRTRYGGGVRIDYKIGEHAEVFANLTLSPHAEPGEARSVIFQTGLSVAALDAATGEPVGPGAVIPGYTDEKTEARPLPTSFVSVRNLLHDRKARAASAQVSGRVRRDGWEIDFDASYSYARNKLWNYSSLATLRGVGFTTDSTGHERWHPRVIVTSGPDTFDLGNYRENQLTHLDTPIQNELEGIQLNARKDLPFLEGTYLKAGIKVRRERQERWNDNQRWRYGGADGIVGTEDDGLAGFARDYNYAPVGGHYPSRPFADTSAMVADLGRNPDHWEEDHEYRVQQNLTGQQRLSESVTAAYLMGNTRLGRLSVLGGLRIEQTRVSGSGALRELKQEEIARRAAWTGPLTDEEVIRRTTAEYGARRTAADRYRNSFPGIHLKFEPRSGFLLRASYSSGIGRHSFETLVPNDSVVDDQQLVIASNPALRPQYTKNYDAGLEYYFHSMGMASVNAFLKQIDGFFYDTSETIPAGEDNGFGGEYAGYELRTKVNGGEAELRGVEVSVQQQLAFLPAPWDGLGFFGNVTLLASSGDYSAGGQVQTTGQVAGFNPQAANLGISYIRGNVNFRIHFGHSGRFLSTFTTQDHLKQYRLAENRVDLKLKYILGRHWEVYVDAYNLFNDKWRLEYGSQNRPRQSNDRHDPQFHFGLNGRF